MIRIRYLLFLPMFFAACNDSEPQKAAPPAAAVVPAPITFERFVRKDFAFDYPAHWRADTLHPAPAIFTALPPEGQGPALTFQAMVLVDEDGLDLQEFARVFVQEKTTTQAGSRGFVQTIQANPFPIVNALKRLKNDGTSSSFYFYKLNATDVLCLLFTGPISALTHYRPVTERIVASVDPKP